MRKFLYWLTARLPARFIDHNGEPYLERYYLATLFGWRIYIHRFVASDQDGLHDHPFLYSKSIILAGWYWEDRWAGRRKRRFFNSIGPDDFHRVVLPDNGRDVWTLFMHTPRVKGWGFLRLADGSDQYDSYQYTHEACPQDPPFSVWYREAPRGAELRRVVRCIPLGYSLAGAADAMPAPRAAEASAP